MLDVILGSILGEWWALRRRVRRLSSQACVDGAVRVLSGSVPGVYSAVWVTGVWSVESGQISMDRLRLPVDEVLEGTRRPTAAEAFWAAGPDVEVYRVRSGTAVLEWAFLPSQREWVVQRLFESRPPG